MKKPWLIVLGIIVGLVAGYAYLSIKDGPLKKENAAMKEQITIQKLELEQLEKKSLAEINGFMEQVGVLQGNIDSLMTVNVDLENQLTASQQETEALEAGAALLMTEVQPVLDANPKVKELVFNLMGQVASGKDQIFTLTKQVEAWKGAFTNSEGKVLLRTKEALEYKGLWVGEKDLRLLVEKRCQIQDRRVGILGTRVKLTTMGGVVVAGVALLAILLR